MEFIIHEFPALYSPTVGAVIPGYALHVLKTVQYVRKSGLTHNAYAVAPELAWGERALGPWPAQSRVPGLIGPLPAPNGILRASPGRELRGGVDSGPGLAPRAGKGAEMSGYPGWVGPDFGKFSGFFPEWSGMA